MPKPLFVHFTPSVEDLLSVVNNGLLFRSRRRNVWKYFTREASNRRPEYKRRIYGDREPQQFGMASIHEFIGAPDKRTADQFGPFGILVTQDWVVRSGFRRVLYVKEGNNFHRHTLQPAFESALKELDECMAQAPKDDTVPLMAYHNAAIADLYGARRWAEYLREYEILEPAKHRHQQEWRFSNPIPDYSSLSLDVLKRDLKEKCGWPHVLNVLKLSPDDVLGFVCPIDNQVELRDSLPDKLSRLPIFSPRSHILRSMLKKPSPIRDQRD